MRQLFDLTQAPPAIQNLLSWLETEGFSLTEESIGDMFNQDGTMVSGNLKVWINADRGGWSLGLGMQGMSRSYSPDTWEAWLDDFPLTGDRIHPDLDHQVEFIKTRWRGAVERALANPEADAEMRAISEDYTYRQFGIPPRSG